MSNRDKVEDLLDRAEKFRKDLDINTPPAKSRLTKKEREEDSKILDDIIQNPSKYFKRKVTETKGVEKNKWKKK